MKARPFPDMIAALLRELQLEMPAGPPQEVYSLHFDGQPSLHLIGRVDAPHVDILTEATQLREPQEVEPLLALLELNAWDLHARAVTTLMLHRPSRTIIIGLRHAAVTMDPRALSHDVDAVRRRADAVRKHCVKVSAPLSGAGTAPRCACCSCCGGHSAMASTDPILAPAQSPHSCAAAAQLARPTHASGGELDPSTPVAMMLRELGLAATLRVSVNELADLIPEWDQGSFRMWRKHPGGLAELAFRSPSGEAVRVLAGESGKALYDELHAYRRLCQQSDQTHPGVPESCGIPYSYAEARSHWKGRRKAEFEPLRQARNRAIGKVESGAAFLQHLSHLCDAEAAAGRGDPIATGLIVFQVCMHGETAPVKIWRGVGADGSIDLRLAPVHACPAS